MKKIRLKKGAYYTKMKFSVLSAQESAIAAKVLLDIKERHGHCGAEILVAEAVAEDHPLHNKFTWEDSKAAHHWRLQEARQITRSIRIILDPKVPEEDQPEIRAFVHVKADDKEIKFEGDSYLPIIDVFESKTYTQQILDRAMDELRGWQKRYSEYKSVFGAVFEAIDGIDLPE